MPPVRAVLLDVALAPDFATSGSIFFSFAEPRDGGNGTSLASARLVRDGAGGGKLEDVKVIFRQTPTYDGNKHYGSRIVVADDHLFLTVGERSDEPIRDQAQDLSSGLGKVFRIDFVGKALPDNPFCCRSGRRPSGDMRATGTEISSLRPSTARVACGRSSTDQGAGTN